MNELNDFLENWPKAVDPELICDENSEEDKTQRAKNILSFFVQTSVDNKKVLDFGCGEGHVVLESINNNATAYGYDIKKSGSSSWDDQNSVLFTDLEKIKSLKPFDVIIMYDVLDHATDMKQCIRSVRDLCDEQTLVYVLTHPWCSRHGGHLYRTFNYAFAHILFEEMDESINKVVNPIMIYEKLFRENGLKIQSKEMVKDPVEDFFEKEQIKQKIINKFNSIAKGFGKLPRFQMEQSFHEYVLKIK